MAGAVGRIEAPQQRHTRVARVAELVKKAASEKCLALLGRELNSEEWRERWTNNGTPQVSDMVGKVLREAAPSFVEAWMGNYAQQIVHAIRNGQIRPY